MKSITARCRLISVLIILTMIVTGWKNTFILEKAEIAIQHGNISSESIFLIAIGSLFLILNTAAAAGLFFVKRWGFFFAYCAIIFSTIFFSTPYVPIISKILPFPLWISLIIINCIILFYTIYLHNLFLEKNISG